MIRGYSQSRGIGGSPQSPTKTTTDAFNFRSRLRPTRDAAVPAPGREPPKPPMTDSPGEMKKVVNDALRYFDRHQLAEAEVQFQRALCSMENDKFPGRERLFVQSLGGLAELYFKRSRSRRDDDMEWHRLMVQSAALQEQLVRYTDELTERYDAMTEQERRKWSWLDDAHKKAKQQLLVLDKVLVDSLQHHVAPSVRRRPTDQIAQASTFVDTGWLDRFRKHIQEKPEPQYENGLLSPRNHSEELNLVSPCSDISTTSSVDSAGGLRSRKLDCDRVQRTIMKLVQQISSDMRQRFIRKKLSEKMFRETVSSEMISKFALMAETRDVLQLFENAIIQYNYGVSAEEFMTWGVETNEVDSNETTSTDTQSDDQSPVTLPYMPGVYEANPGLDSPLEDDTYNFPGVLTLWRAYDKHHHAHVRSRLPPLRPYLLQGFEELSPLTETNLLSSEHSTSSSQVSTPSSTDISRRTHSSSSSSSTSSSPVDAPPPNYVSQNKLQVALAGMLFKCARQLQQQPQAMNQACELYKYALGILRASAPETVGRQHQIAHILKNVGIIRCSQGDISIGSQLMHEAMELFSPDDNIENINVAEVWYDLGEAYMLQQWKEDSIFEHVMRLVQEELGEDIGSDSADSDCGDDVSIDSDSSDGAATYSVCSHEAMGCYKSALAILSRLRRRQEIHTSLYVDVLTKLGDCSIMVGEYERSILCYEEALYLCQNTLGSVSLTNSAHILSMLGTTNFLLGTYSKAATMYETANILQQHLYGLDDNFEMAFTMSMLGNTYYVMRQYHKCIAWCIKAFELYVNIYKQEIIFVDSLHRWFIAHTLYCLGFAYSHLNFHDKAIHNLDLAKNMIERAPSGEVDLHQHVKILKVLADVYANTEQNETALICYQEALDLSLKLGDERSATTLQNQLLNRMAGIHVNTKQYDTAAEYLEQALDCQRNVETNIKGDLISIMYQLGNTYTLSGDIDRAIECYNECYEEYQEAHASPGPEMAQTLCNLGSLYHLKGCMQDDNDEMIEYLDSADQYYKDAIAKDKHSAICVHYGNFLYQQEQYAESLEAMLRYVFLHVAPDDQEIHYNGPEQAVLPEHLLYDLNDIDEVRLDPRVFARFLGILCLRQLGLHADALDCLVAMVRIVGRTRVGINYSMLGYALIEMGLYPEAAEAFGQAATLQNDDEYCVMNQWLSLGLWVYSVLSKAFHHIWEVTTEAYIDLCGPAQTPTPSLPVFLPDVSMDTEFRTLPSIDTQYRTLRDSGYYDHSEDVTMETSRGLMNSDHLPDILSPISAGVAANEDVFHDDSYHEWQTEEVVETPTYLLQAIIQSQASENNIVQSQITNNSIILSQASENNIVQSQTSDNNIIESQLSEQSLIQSPDITSDSIIQSYTSGNITYNTESALETAVSNMLTHSTDTSISYFDHSTSQGHVIESEADHWITEEEVTLETPSAIIAALSGKLTMDQDKSQFESHRYEYDGELKHKSAYSSYDENNYGMDNKTSTHDWSTKHRSAAPPDLLAGLQNNYSNQVCEEKRSKTFAFTSSTHQDSNGNGTFRSSSILPVVQSSDYSRTIECHYDGLNGNANTDTTATICELNANTVRQEGEEEEEEVWETWETTEEVVETPSIILQAMMANQNRA